jgi:hypothetical protein
MSDILDAALRALGLAPPTREHRFAPPRRWQFDYAWPDLRVGLKSRTGSRPHGAGDQGGVPDAG